MLYCNSLTIELVACKNPYRNINTTNSLPAKINENTNHYQNASI